MRAAARPRPHLHRRLLRSPIISWCNLPTNEMETVTSSENAEWALGTDDRAYRKADDYDEHYTRYLS